MCNNKTADSQILKINFALLCEKLCATLCNNKNADSQILKIYFALLSEKLCATLCNNKTVLLQKK